MVMDIQQMKRAYSKIIQNLSQNLHKPVVPELQITLPLQTQTSLTGVSF